MMMEVAQFLQNNREGGDSKHHPNTLDDVANKQEESPTVVLDRDDLKSPLNMEPTSFDPFRDVIRTEPAPDLPSLIEDMIPYLEHRITTSTVTSLPLDPQIPPGNPNFRDKFEDVLLTTDDPKNSLPTTAAEKTTKIGATKFDNSSTNSGDQGEPAEEEDDEGTVFSFDSMLDLLFADNPAPSGLDKTTVPSADTSIPKNNSSPTEETRVADEVIENTSSASSDQFSKGDFKVTIISEGIKLKNSTEEVNDGKEVPIGGLLKLAGCNIYGRMYRVGRIIVELSTPCLECRCTDLGVQCKQLEC